MEAYDAGFELLSTYFPQLRDIKFYALRRKFCWNARCFVLTIGLAGYSIDGCGCDVFVRNLSKIQR
jgi:hypothetical protein